jgi:hypothetical protein
VFTILASTNIAKFAESIYNVEAPIHPTVTNNNGGHQEYLQVNMGSKSLKSRYSLQFRSFIFGRAKGFNL